MWEGLEYQFELKDLTKYSQTLKDKDLDFKFRTSALGKVIEHDGDEDESQHHHDIHIKKNIEKIDWSDSPLY